ncbi:zinc knuckle CX2CX4HX4C containing protein [Tanacetum coccineum]
MGVKEKQSLMEDKSVKVSKHVNEALGSNSATRTPNVVNADLKSFPTVSKAHGIHSPASANEENMNDVGIVNNVAKNGTVAVNFRTLITPAGNGVDVVVPVVSIRAINGLDAMLENGPWFIRNNLLILKKWNPGVNVLKEDVGNVSVWVKLHGIPGKSSYARTLIEIRGDVELKDNIVDECPKTIDLGVVKNLKKPSQAFRGVSVGLNVGFKPTKQVYRPVSKKTNANTSENKKKNVEHSKENSNSNPFDVLYSVENDVDFGINRATSNLASKKANSSGSSFWNVKSSSTSTTHVVEKIDKIERLIIDEKVTLVDDEGKPLEKVDSSSDHDNEDEVESVDNEIWKATRGATS